MIDTKKRVYTKKELIEAIKCLDTDEFLIDYSFTGRCDNLAMRGMEPILTETRNHLSLGFTADLKSNPFIITEGT